MNSTDATGRPTPLAANADEQVINDNGAWCWFQDERALVDPDAGVLVVGSIAAAEGPGGEGRVGDLDVTVVDLRTGEATVTVLHPGFEVDDHDVPAFWRRTDGRWGVAYARHKSDDLSWYALSEPGDPTAWGEPQAFDWSDLTAQRGVTYSNLHRWDGRLWWFARAINDDPSALVSDDEGATWSFAGKLFTRDKVGYVNSYTRYSSAPDADRIDILATDHHPRDYDNSIYHGYLADGALRASDGSVVDAAPLDGDAPNQDALTTVIAAGTRMGGATLTHFWTTDIRRVGDQVAAVVTARADDRVGASDLSDPEWWGRLAPIPDHRFVYARLGADGTWGVHHLAPAGAGLLPHEQDYTGLAAIDPYDADTLYLSTPLDPRDGAPTAHHEIYRGHTTDRGATWTWDPVTQDSDADNLRPIVAPGDPSITPLLWFRGSMTASQHFDCEVVLRVLPRG
ncbi:hypothetical protein G7070_02045 [Propioniciclava coleopterorum]|uniref:BNR repeat-containing family member n=1 Tax=Propioniciclava coleopterorum TaxID=2714937 RepID=A0A6G7Y3N1_9ACTN|nr:BNR-4 repeat-containing protein [Propioniciclava coleopterorum]QIK71286.1 hypothetical protein G7070_02045 [Propioniciclava coleopterorum]